jgi:pantothenate synthetase
MILACASGVFGEKDFAEVAVIRQAAMNEVAKVVRALMIVMRNGREMVMEIKVLPCLAALHNSRHLLASLCANQARDAFRLSISTSPDAIRRHQRDSCRLNSYKFRW